MPHELTTLAHFDFDVRVNLDAQGQVSDVRETIVDRRPNSTFRYGLDKLISELASERALQISAIRERETEIEAELGNIDKLGETLGDSTQGRTLDGSLKLRTASSGELDVGERSDDFWSFFDSERPSVVDELMQELHERNKKQRSESVRGESFEISDLLSDLISASARTPSNVSQFAINVDLTKPVDEAQFAKCTARKWPFKLDPFQKRAIMLIEAHENVLVAAHTSAGKTVVSYFSCFTFIRLRSNVL